jgi:hypothetical protein
VRQSGKNVMPLEKKGTENGVVFQHNVAPLDELPNALPALGMLKIERDLAKPHWRGP